MLTRLLAEQPVLLSLLLTVVAGACLYAWLQTAHKAAFAAGLVCLALIPGAWYLAASWTTDREAILERIEEAATAINRNDFETVYTLIAPSRPETLEQARNELPRYEFSQAKIGQIRSLQFVQGALPPEAIVDATASVVVSQKGGGISEAKVVRRVMLRFRKLNDRWYVTDYTHMPIIGGPDQFSPASDLHSAR